MVFLTFSRFFRECCFLVLVMPPLGGEIVAYCRICRYADMPICRYAAHSNHSKHTSTYVTIATALYGQAVAPLARAIGYTVSRDCAHTVDTVHAIADSSIPCPRFQSPPRNSLLRRVPQVDRTSLLARGHLLPSHGSHGYSILQYPTYALFWVRHHYSNPTSIREDRGKRPSWRGPGVTSVPVPIFF